MITIKYIQRTMCKFYGVKLTKAQVQEFIKNEFAPDHGFDTIEREKFANFLARKIAGMNFPLNSDSKACKEKFHVQIKTKSAQMGYEWEL